MSLQSALDLALETINFPRDHPLYRYGRWRLRLIGPWRFPDGIKWQAIAEPHNATGHDLDSDIEGLGSSPEEAFLALVTKINKIPRRREAPNMCGCGHSPHVGFICGYPIGRTQDRVKCKCEG